MLTTRSPAFRTVRTDFCYFISRPNHRILLKQPKWTKTIAKTTAVTIEASILLPFVCPAFYTLSILMLTILYNREFMILMLQERNMRHERLSTCLRSHSTYTAEHRTVRVPNPFPSKVLNQLNKENVWMRGQGLKLYLGKVLLNLGTSSRFSPFNLIKTISSFKKKYCKLHTYYINQIVWYYITNIACN